ncbi:trehalose-phosphatase [Luteimonas aquatica]|uniref:trehalose-phosphatase n=1 Tax=Luteimonas aquatica TaxID=450364 RepID=UPI001F5ABD90|nr:trehalose-phosphatase [Luteimonas aquatica]
MATSPSSARPAPPAPAGNWALFLDVDGCLLELAETPDAVVVPAGLRERLDALRAGLDGALALVSGRAVVTLDALFAPSRFDAAGLHGTERRRHGVDEAGIAVPAELAALRRQAETIAGDYRGAVVEDKGAALALHWRRAPEAEHPLQAFALQALTHLPGYRLQHGKQVVELRPAHADKGDAIAAFLERPPYAGRVPVFAGDDLTDESGFAQVNARGGVSILVADPDARRDSAARYGLRDPAAVRAWLGVAP